MTHKIIATLPAFARPLIEAQLPDWVWPRWFANKAEALAAGPGTEIGWFDMVKKPAMAQAVQHATDMKWLNSLYAGVDGLPLNLLAERGVTLTNGAGLNSVTIAEYVVMGMLNIAKGYRAVVHAQQRHEWLAEAPGTMELLGSRALLLGYGAIGQLIDARLRAFGVEVSVVRRTPDATRRMLGPDQWRARLGEFDWVILAVPATPETERMMNRAVFARMRPDAYLINISRGILVDEEALEEALITGRIAGAGLDVGMGQDEQPHPRLAALPNVIAVPHVAGLTREATDHQAFETVRQIRDLIAGKLPELSVNGPMARRLDRLRSAR